MAVTDTRTKADFVHQMKALVDIHHPHADCIRLVVGNLNIHPPAALATVSWRFTTTDARVKLGHLYPAVEPSKVAW